MEEAGVGEVDEGQARKSLWIETTGPNMCVGNYFWSGS